jgi:hypothetical protein
MYVLYVYISTQTLNNHKSLKKKKHVYNGKSSQYDIFVFIYIFFRARKISL